MKNALSKLFFSILIKMEKCLKQQILQAHEESTEADLSPMLLNYFSAETLKLW